MESNVRNRLFSMPRGRLSSQGESGSNVGGDGRAFKAVVGEEVDLNGVIRCDLRPRPLAGHPTQQSARHEAGLPDLFAFIFPKYSLRSAGMD